VGVPTVDNEGGEAWGKKILVLYIRFSRTSSGPNLGEEFYEWKGGVPEKPIGNLSGDNPREKSKESNSALFLVKK